jgi:hypothetical protein
MDLAPIRQMSLAMVRASLTAPEPAGGG